MSKADNELLKAKAVSQEAMQQIVLHEQSARELERI